MFGAYLLGLAATVAIPYLLWRVFVNNNREVYDGPATVLCVSLLGNQRYDKDNDFVNVDVPGYGIMLHSVPAARVQQFSPAANVIVTLRKPLIGPAYIASIIWPGEKRVEAQENSGAALFLGTTYLMLGMAALIAMPHDASAFAQHLMLYASALVLALGGFVFGTMTNSKLGDIAESQSRFLGIPLGRGTTGLILMTVLCAAINAAIFWTPSILLLLGLNTAFAMGGCLALLKRSLQR
jgi:hypothetical protein